jgi:hypothetical protein
MTLPARIRLASLHVIFLVLCITQTGWPQEKPKAKVNDAGSFPEMTVPRAAVSPRVDGNLDDAAWKNAPLPTGEWLTYNPVTGNKLVQRTQVWATYDDAALYFAFHCMDPEPDKIKTSISRRDTIFNDDWVGLSLDSLGSHQSSYEFMVNPSGVQADLLNSSTAGETTSPDWVWESAARMTEDGYTAEIRIPFKTIRFKSGAKVRMEVLFWRRVSRLGMSASWPALTPGASIFARHAPLLLQDVKQPLTLELIPNLTYALNQTRSQPDRWASDSKPDGGITAKFGISSTVTLDGTFRPDFSQVESDAFQVEVNQRYPIFYSEKRPFFMEGMGTFELAGSGGDGNMRTVVHTRRIMDPLYGLKLSGTLGKVTFAALSSSDRSPGNTEPTDPLFEKEKYFNIGRLFYSIGKGSYVGGLLTDTELGDSGHNRVLAGDLSLQFGEHHQFSATAISTYSRDFDGSNQRKGMGGQASYYYDTKRQVFGTQFEHYDKDFQMDTAFYNRTGITSNWTYYSYNFYPDEKRYHWFNKFAPFVWFSTGRDRIQQGKERFAIGGIRLYFTRQGNIQVDYGGGKEAWIGRTFHFSRTRMRGSAQFFRWLNVQAGARFGGSIYYDTDNQFLGNSRTFDFECTLQPSSKLSQSIGYDRVVFNRDSDGSHVYTVDIINTKTTYQFNKHLFVRAIERYDSSRQQVLMDYLVSYEPVPGTVAYAGYGTLLDRDEWNGTEFVPGQGNYRTMQRGLFFKLSYLFRF